MKMCFSKNIGRQLSYGNFYLCHNACCTAFDLRGVSYVCIHASEHNTVQIQAYACMQKLHPNNVVSCYSVCRLEGSMLEIQARPKLNYTNVAGHMV